MTAVHHPCCGDLLCGADSTLAAHLGLTRQWLHAVRLAFERPGTGREVIFESAYAFDAASSPSTSWVAESCASSVGIWPAPTAVAGWRRWRSGYFLSASTRSTVTARLLADGGRGGRPAGERSGCPGWQVRDLLRAIRPAARVGGPARAGAVGRTARGGRPEADIARGRPGPTPTSSPPTATVTRPSWRPSATPTPTSSARRSCWPRRLAFWAGGQASLDRRPPVRRAERAAGHGGAVYRPPRSRRPSPRERRRRADHGLRRQTALPLPGRRQRRAVAGPSGPGDAQGLDAQGYWACPPRLSGEHRRSAATTRRRTARWRAPRRLSTRSCGTGPTPPGAWPYDHRPFPRAIARWNSSGRVRLVGTSRGR